jgi:hypothetical protein
MPAGLLVTVPVPVPALVIVRGNGGFLLNVAVQFLDADIVTMTFDPTPEQSPLQLLKFESGSG